MEIPVMQIIEFGVIKELQVPQSWSRFDFSGMRSSSIVFRINSEPLVEIVLLESGRAISEKSAALFKELVSNQIDWSTDLSTKLNHGLPSKPGTSSSATNILYSKQFSSNSEVRALFQTLAGALDSTLVGDNQLIADTTLLQAPLENSRAPAFEINEARVESINEKNVIAVDGFFRRLDETAQPMMNESGEAVKRYYTGIFFESAHEHAKIDEVYLSCDDANLFEQSKSIFRTFLRSLKWR